MVAIPFRRRQPVSESLGTIAVDLRDSSINIPASVLFWIAITAIEDDTYSEEIIDFFEWDILHLHLTPDRVASLDASLHLVGESHLLEASFERGGKAVEEIFSALFALLNLTLDLCISLWMLIAEA